MGSDTTRGNTCEGRESGEERESCDGSMTLFRPARGEQATENPSAEEAHDTSARRGIRDGCDEGRKARVVARTRVAILDCATDTRVDKGVVDGENASQEAKT